MATPRAPDADVGVLFVHGIGVHGAGATLEHMGTALIDHVRQRLEAGGRGGVRVDGGAPAAGAGGARDVVLFVDGERPVRWRLAEANWDRTFPDPTLPEVVRWSLLVAPWVMHREAFLWWRRFGHGLSLTVRGVWNLGVYFVRLLAFIVASAVLQVVVLGLLALVWLPPVRLLLQLVLVRTVGDAYRFVGHPESASAMARAVAHQLEQLAASSRRVVVVAHSQGAAVVLEALRLRPPPPGFCQLVTLGPGLPKLGIVRDLVHDLRPAAYWTVVRLALLAAVLAAGDVVEETALVALTTSALVVAMVMPTRGMLRGRRRARASMAATPGLGSTWSWLDLWSRRDLVPEGALDLDHPSVTSLPVDNAASWWRDHVTYTANHGQVMALVFGRLVRLSGLIYPGLVDEITWTWQQRAHRVGVLARRRRIAGVIGVFLVPVSVVLLLAVGVDPSGLWVLVPPIAALSGTRLWWDRWDRRARAAEPTGSTLPSSRDRRPRRPEREHLDPACMAMVRGVLEARPSRDDREPPAHPAARSTRVGHLALTAYVAAYVGLAVVGVPVAAATTVRIADGAPDESSTVLALTALGDPRLQAFMLGAIVLPGLALDTHGEIVRRRGAQIRAVDGRVHVGVLLVVPVVIIATGAAVIHSVRDPANLAVGDCYEPDPTRTADDVASVVRISCTEPHRGEVVITENIGSAFERTQAGAAAACQPSVLRWAVDDPWRVEAVVSVAPTIRGFAAPPALVCSLEARCDVAVVGRLGAGVRVLPRTGPVRHCSADVSPPEIGRGR